MELLPENGDKSLFKKAVLKLTPTLTGADHEKAFREGLYDGTETIYPSGSVDFRLRKNEGGMASILFEYYHENKRTLDWLWR